MAPGSHPPVLIEFFLEDLRPAPGAPSFPLVPLMPRYRLVRKAAARRLASR